jgi:selenocysteine-specific elongation factor
VSQTADPRRVVIATAGHVDHGKTTLVRALTGTDTDRLPEEKRRGISIELGFAELASARMSFIDVPGHHKLVHAMIAGVGGVDAVLLIVAADDGVMPQTREHLAVCALLGVKEVVVALTKADLVDQETLELAEEDARSALEALGLEARAVVPTSAALGKGVRELEQALIALAERIPPRATSARVWLPIDRVFSITGAGTVVTGTLTRGSIRVGAPLFAASERGMLETSARALEVHGQSVEEARAPTRLAINLARLELAELARGDLLTADPEIVRSRRLDVALTTLPGAERSLKDRSPVLVHLGTTRVTGRIFRFGDGLFHLELEHPVPCEGGVGLVLRGFRDSVEHGRVLAGGRVLDAGAGARPRRKDSGSIELRSRALSQIRADALADALCSLVDLASPRPLDAHDAERRLGLEPGRARVLLSASGAVPVAGERLWSNARALDAAGELLLSFVARFHAEHPHQSGVSAETARTALAERTGRELAARVFERLREASKLNEVEHGLVCLPAFAESARPKAQQATSAVEQAVDGVGLGGASEADAQRLSGEKPEVVRAALTRLAGAGTLRRLGGLWFAERHLDALREAVARHFSEHASLSVPEFKELAGVSRKQAIPLLEQLDREGTTRRQGDDRVLGAGRAK